LSGLIQALNLFGSGRDLDQDQARLAVGELVAGEVPEPLVAAFLTALRVKGESAAELAGAVAAVLERMTPWDPLGMPTGLLDTCGTGGDGARSVNISTASAIVVAAVGVPVAKHGNRSASGNSGSAEVLSELGVEVEADQVVLRRCLSELGLTFLYAPRFHPALRSLASVRKQLPFRTLFNLVGPLANPTRPAYQLIGAPEPRIARLMAEATARLGVHRAAVVTGADGLDEVSLAGETQVWWVEAGEIRERTWTRDDFGLEPVNSADLGVSGPTESAQRLRALFAGEPGPARATVLANSAAALLVAGKTGTLREGVAMASEAIDRGDAARLLERWAIMTRG
jgi:anthranilate phosphoribosyltransferase